MTLIIKLARFCQDNLDHAIWRCQKALGSVRDGVQVTRWRVEGPKGELLAEGP